MTELNRRDLLRAGAAGALGLWLPFATDARSATWHARAANSRVPRRALAELRRALHGTLLLPGDPGYDAASAPANFRYDSIRPLAVASCRNEADVITCVDWSRAHHVPPVARGGGHSYAGYSTTEGLLVDIGQLNHVAVDHRSGHAVMAGAALNQNVLDATVDRQFVLPGGTCLAVGVGGLTLGGGIGYNTHWGGLTCDHLLSTRMVTAGGRVVHADREHHPDLFWACRGGAGGNFGINTQFTFQLPEIPAREVAFYRFDWRGADAAAAVLRAFDRLLTRDTQGFNAVAMAQASPVGAGGPREAIDVFSRGQFIGTQAELERYVQPLIDAAGPPAKRTLTTLKYWDMQRMFASSEGTRHSFGDVSRYSKAPLPDDTYAKIADLLAVCPSRTPESNGSMWSLGWIGGPAVRRFHRRRDRVRPSRHAHAAARDSGVGKRRPEVGAERADRLDRADDPVGRAPHAGRELSELPKSRNRQLAAAVLRGELRATGPRQDEVRPAQPVSQPAEHPRADRACQCTTTLS